MKSDILTIIFKKSSLKDIFYLFFTREEEREKQRERYHLCERETLITCFLYTLPYQGLNPEPTQVP